MIAGGILCVSLSGAVARPGSWWQSTLDAFGVGFVVGGIVDVLAISALTRFSAASQRASRRELNGQAMGLIFCAPSDREVSARVASEFLAKYGDKIDADLRARLRKMADGDFGVKKANVLRWPPIARRAHPKFRGQD